MSREYSEKQLAELQKIKTEVLCRKCNYAGYKDDKTLCDCMKKFIFIKELYFSEIPYEYWKFYLDEGLKEKLPSTIHLYCERIPTAIEKGLGMILTSVKRGSGKTTAMAIAGKAGIILGKRVYYTFFQNIIDDRFSENKDVEERIRNSDIILIDEVDKSVMKKDSPLKAHFEILIRSLASNKKSIIFATNGNDAEIGELFGMNEYFKGYFKLVSMFDENFRDTRKEKWDSAIKENQNYKNCVDMRDVEEFIKNRG